MEPKEAEGYSRRQLTRDHERLKAIERITMLVRCAICEQPIDDDERAPRCGLWDDQPVIVCAPCFAYETEELPG